MVLLQFVLVEGNMHPETVLEGGWGALWDPMQKKNNNNNNDNGFKFRFGVERRHRGPLSPWNQQY